MRRVIGEEGAILKGTGKAELSRKAITGAHGISVPRLLANRYRNPLRRSFAPPFGIDSHQFHAISICFEIG